ncbi:hypothetical protein BJV74DRAFT_770181, partial [Russula compacta]
MVAGIVDSGSQIIAIRKDLALKVGTHISPNIRLEMEGANSATNWTLGCTEHLTIQVGGVPFKVHAHVVEQASFCLLLGRLFQKLLQSSLKDRPNGNVDVIIWDPCVHSRHIAIPSRER